MLSKTPGQRAFPKLSTVSPVPYSGYDTAGPHRPQPPALGLKTFEETYKAKCWQAADMADRRDRRAQNETYKAYMTTLEAGPPPSLQDSLKMLDAAVRTQLEQVATVRQTGPGQFIYMHAYKVVKRTLTAMYPAHKLAVFVWLQLLPERTNMSNYKMAVAALWASIRASTLRKQGALVLTCGSDATVQYMAVGPQRLCVPIKFSPEGLLTGVDLINMEETYVVTTTPCK